QVTVTETFLGINADIPDGSLSGLSDRRTITQSGPISEVSVTINISGSGFGTVNGDYYAYLTHGSGMAVLLNRSGVRSASSLGYDDNGFSSVTFSDSASKGDVHNYRMTLFGDHITPIGATPSALTGTWQPDGRSICPRSAGATIDAASRTAMLSSFQSLNINGDWTLFIADVAGGGKAKLTSWSMTVTAVPEPLDAVLAIAMGLLAFGAIR